MSHKGYKYYNNGTEVKYFIPGQQPDGWTLGTTEEYKQKTHQKRIETCLERYGVANTFQTEKCIQNNSSDAAKEKMKQSRLQTMQEKYGVDNPSQLQEVKDNKKETYLQNHGVECGFQTDLCKKITNEPSLVAQKLIKSKLTILERYGVSNPYLIPRVYNKSHSPEAYAKAKRTCAARIEEEKIQILAKSLQGRSVYIYNDVQFDSSWELAFWIFCQDHHEKIEREPVRLEYYFEDQKHYYIPDFRINDEQLIEIKSDYLLKLMQQENTREFAKYQCMVQNNVRILTLSDILFYLNYIEEQYGANYLSQFKQEKKEKKRG